MINIEETTLKELILRSEPDFIAQYELQLNGYGVAKNLGEDNGYAWIWNKERVRTANEEELNYLVLKIID